MAGAPEPEPEREHLRWQRLRDAALEAERETGRREESEAEARSALHIRLARMTVGTLVVIAGIILLPLPGPGWLIIAGGLAILAKDVAWADRLLERVRRRLPSDEDGSVSTPVIVGSIAFAVLTVAASLWWTFLR